MCIVLGSGYFHPNLHTRASIRRWFERKTFFKFCNFVNAIDEIESPTMQTMWGVSLTLWNGINVFD